MTTLPFLLAAAAALSPEVDQGVTRAIEDEIREAKAPGAAVAVVKDGEVVYLKAFGVRSAGWKRRCRGWWSSACSSSGRPDRKSVV